jgi:hypothetical protein
MPGLDRRGPMNDGPMTGGRKGLCTGVISPGQVFSAGGGYGSMRRAFGRRRCQAPEWGASVGRNYCFRTDPFDAKNRTDMLEAEITEIKQQLKRMSEPVES